MRRGRWQVRCKGTREDRVHGLPRLVAARRGPGAARGYARRDLREAARAWGPDHFDADGETPFQYAIVLLVAGDYAGAVGHLGDRRLPQEALHLALALDAYGVLDVAAAPASKRPKLLSPAGGATGAGGYDLGRACLAYARHVAVADPALALEYTVKRNLDAGAAQKLSQCDTEIAEQEAQRDTLANEIESLEQPLAELKDHINMHFIGQVKKRKSENEGSSLQGEEMADKENRQEMLVKRIKVEGKLQEEEGEKEKGEVLNGKDSLQAPSVPKEPPTALTCSNCNISFVNPSTYSAHVQFYCKKKTEPI